MTDDRAQEIIDLDDALNKLAAFNERWSKVVECLYFGGLTQEEAAGVLGVSVRTVERDWKHARAWLYNVMRAPVKASS